MCQDCCAHRRTEFGTKTFTIWLFRRKRRGAARSLGCILQGKGQISSPKVLECDVGSALLPNQKLRSELRLLDAWNNLKVPSKRTQNNSHHYHCRQRHSPENPNLCKRHGQALHFSREPRNV